MVAGRRRRPRIKRAHRHHHHLPRACAPLVRPRRRWTCACQKRCARQPVLLESPQGTTFNHELAAELARKPRIALWCGRYEGIDQRFIDEHIDAEISIGDFVLSGGEIAAAIIIDAVLRLIPGVLGDAASAAEDSFHHKLLDHPHYTRPENTAKIRAPEILLSGNHALIARWRLKQALGRTFLHRPDILNQLELSDAQQKLLNEFLTEQHFGEPS